MKLRQKVTVATFAIALLPFTAAMTIALLHSSKQVRTLTVDTVQGRLNTGAQALSGYFSSRKAEIAAYANMPLIKTMDWQEIAPYLRSELVRKKGTYEKLLLGRLDSHYYVTAGGNPAHGGLASFDDADPHARLKSIGQRPYWRVTTSQTDSKQPVVYVSDPMISYTTGVNQVMVASGIVDDQGRRLGMIAGAIEWSEVESRINAIRDRMLSDMPTRCQLFLVSAGGVYIYHWDPQKVVHLLFDAEGNPLVGDIGEKVVARTKVTEEPAPQLAQAAKLMLDGRSGTAFFIDPQSEEEMTVTYAPVESADYSIALVLPKSRIMAPVNQLRWILAAIMAATVVIVLITSVFIGRIITVPITALSDATKRIARGDKHTPIESTSTDEVGELTQTLNTMLQTLHQRQDSLIKSENRFRAVAENASSAVVTADIKGTVVFWNKTAEKMFGYPAHEILGKPLTRIMPKRYRHAHLKGMKRVETTGKTRITGKVVELYGLRKDSTEFPLDLSLSMWKDEDQRFFTALMNDVTDRKKAEEKIVKQEQRLRTLVENIPGAVYRSEVVPPWRFEHISEAIFAITGWHANRFVEGGAFIDDLIVPEDFQRVSQAVKESVRNRTPFNVEYGIRHKDGSVHHVLERGRAIYDNEGNPLWLDGVILDTSDRWLAETERKQLLKTVEARNRELQDIVYVASHDLKAPLINIRGFGDELTHHCGHLENLLTKPAINDTEKHEIDKIINQEIPESLEFINAGTDKMTMLINGLLQVSRVGSVEFKIEPLDMNKIIEQIVETLGFQARKQDVSVTIDKLPSCMGDRAKTNQVFSNLLNNAMKYLDPQRKGKIHVSGFGADNESVYCVEDNGIGISPGHQHRVFEAFHRLNPHDDAGGEGLGLTIVMRILDRQNGRIRVESEPGTGSKFYVSLPAPTP